MALSFVGATVGEDFVSVRLEGHPLEIRIHPDVIDGIAHEILDHPERETCGALLGHREQDDELSKPETLWIERFVHLDSAAAPEEPDGVGFYRGTAAPGGFPDSDAPANSLLLLIQPDTSGTLAAQFSLPNAEGELKPVMPAFPFRGRGNGKVRRLVPDFDHAGEPVRPAREFVMQTVPPGDRSGEPEASESGMRRFLVRSWPFLAALALIGGAIWFLPQIASLPSALPSSAKRPLGLAIDTALPEWRISWNRDASALAGSQGARPVRLFIHDGEDQNSIDLSAKDLETGMYRYQPHGSDVTFRMEATDVGGQVSAESFRVILIPEKAPSRPQTPSDAVSVPKAIRKVAPVVAASIRPRIRGKVPIDIRVQVDTRGLVVSANPTVKPHTGVESYLAASALRAARAWRFEPATKDGKAIAGTQTLHFVFEK